MTITVTKVQNGYMLRKTEYGRDTSAYDLATITVVEGDDAQTLAAAIQAVMNPEQKCGCKK